jgi:hypothetical protein
MDVAPDPRWRCNQQEAIMQTVTVAISEDENEFTREFVYLCETSGLDPQEGLRILNAQDWHPAGEEPGYAMHPVTIHEGFV